MRNVKIIGNRGIVVIQVLRRDLKYFLGDMGSKLGSQREKFLEELNKHFEGVAKGFGEGLYNLENVDISARFRDKRMGEIVQNSYEDFLIHTKKFIRFFRNSSSEERLQSKLVIDRVNAFFVDTKIHYKMLAPFLGRELNAFRGMTNKFMFNYKNLMNANIGLLARLNLIREILLEIDKIDGNVVKLEECKDKFEELEQRRREINEEIGDILQSEEFLREKEKKAVRNARLNNFYRAREEFHLSLDFKNLREIYHGSIREMEFIKNCEADVMYCLNEENFLKLEKLRFGGNDLHRELYLRIKNLETEIGKEEFLIHEEISKLKGNMQSLLKEIEFNSDKRKKLGEGVLEKEKSLREKSVKLGIRVV